MWIVLALAALFLPSFVLALALSRAAALPAPRPPASLPGAPHPRLVDPGHAALVRRCARSPEGRRVGRADALPLDQFLWV